MMDIGGLDVGVNYKYGNAQLLEDKDEEALLKLIDQGSVSRINLDSVFREPIDDDLSNLSMVEKNFIMTMQMTPGSPAALSQIGGSGYPLFADPLGLDRDGERKSSYADWPGFDSHSLVNEVGRERKISTSTLMDSSLPSEIMISNMLNSSSDEFTIPGIEDVQEQIFLEDGHQALQPDDLLIPLDDDQSDGKALQEQLINQITGKEPLLTTDIGEASSNGTVFDSLPSKNEVKKVETTPGSPNVNIDGVDVRLPTGSIILAVVDETGSLVPMPATTQGLDTGLSDHATDTLLVPDLGIPSGDSPFLDPVLRAGHGGVPLETLLTTPIHSQNEVEGDGGCSMPLEGGFGGIPDISLPLGVSIKHETPENCPTNLMDIGDEFVNDIEVMSEQTPVIEAVDLDTLLAEFEATEKVNVNINNYQNRSSLLLQTVPENNAKPLPEASSSFTSLIKVEKPLPPQEDNSCQNVALGPPKLLSNISIKVKKVETNKPAKSLIERKNQMMLRRMTAHQKIKDSLPIEIIEKIRASGKRSGTKILTEALTPRLKKKKNASKTVALKRAMNSKLNNKEKAKKNTIENKENKDVPATPTPFPTDHDYCMTPVKHKREKESEVYSKIPNYYHPTHPNDTARSPMEGEDGCKKDSGVESGDFSDSSIEVEENKKRKIRDAKEPARRNSNHGESKEIKSCQSQENLYNRLPDYVTDIGNVKPKEVEEKENEKKESLNESLNDVPSSTYSSPSTSTYSASSSSTSSSPSHSSASPIYSTSLSSQSSLSPAHSSASPTHPSSSPALSTSLLMSSSTTSSDPMPCGFIKEEPVEEAEKEPKKKKKLKLSEYRMRIRTSAENSRSNSPLVSEDALNKKQELKSKKEVEATPSPREPQRDVIVLDDSVPRSVTEEREEGEIKEENDDKEPQDIPEKAKPLPKIRVIPEARMSLLVETQTRISKPPSKPSSKGDKKKPTVIEIDLADDDDEEEETKEQKVQQTKVGLIDTLPLSKMPTTSLGHSLLYSRKSATSPEKKKGKHEHSKSSKRYSSSCSRSRSRSRSSRKSSRSQKSKGSGYTNSHRKSRRRWSRSRSGSRSRTYSISSSSSYSCNSSRSRSRSYSKSFYSRSRSRSKSRRRRESRSKRSKRYNRSRERRHGSRSKSPRDTYSSRRRTKSPNWRYRSRSPYSKSSRHIQPHMSTRYMSRHRSIEEIERDVQERRVIYVGAIEDGTTRACLRRRFEKFGQIVDINIHFRERGDNYGFVTFRYRENAYNALEHGNDDPSLPRYNLCFGGRRSFCKVQYSDLDAQNEDYGYPTAPSSMDYDSLLQAALQMRR